MDYDIVVSAENNHYTCWQSMVFHYTCVKQMGQSPIIVVHGGGELLPGYKQIERMGGRIQRARNYRFHNEFDYAPRNTAGTLQTLQSDADYLVLCDADMMFVKPIPIDRYRLSSDEVSFDRVSYMEVVPSHEMLAPVCERAGIPIEQLAQRPVSGGVPHIIPVDLQRSLSELWLECMDHFDPISVGDGLSLPWVATMWAIDIAVRRLSLKAVMTEFCETNFEGDSRPLIGQFAPYMIHYCYGDTMFNKRNFVHSDWRDLWRFSVAGDTVHAEISRGLQGTAKYFGLS